MKKLISLILTLAMLLGILGTLAVSAATDLPFIDVKADAWYYDEVKTAYDEGIMQGKSKDTFDPVAQTTRAEFVKVLCSMTEDVYLGKGETLAFDDVETDKWYVDYVGWGVEHGIVKGLSVSKFGPDQPVTRQEMAVFIDRFVKYLDKELSNDPQIDSFKDAGEVDSWATESVELMRVSGIITGVGNGYFNPKANASRAEIATVITRLLTVIKNDNNQTDTPPVINPPVIDRGNFDVQEAFMYGDKNDNAAFPYRIYVPEDYSNDKEYPLLVYLHDFSVAGTDNKRQLNDVGILFENPNSPVFDSIVLVPQAPNLWNEYMATQLMDLMDYINSQYSTDNERQYIIGARYGAFTAWKAMVKFPEKISATMFIHGPSAPLGSDGNGNIIEILDNVPAELIDIPVNIVHDLDDNADYPVVGPYTGRQVYYALTELEGFTNVVLTETSGYGANIYKHFVSEDDISLLEWLFDQRRETNTDDKPVNNLVIPDKTGEFVFFDEDDAPISYYLYIPEGYSVDREYPLLVYIRDKGDSSINSVDVCFANSESPAYDSLVLVPEISDMGKFDKLNLLLDYINKKYHTDSHRQYVIATDAYGPFGMWKMLLKHPQKISAVLFIQGISATLGTQSSTGKPVLADDVAYHILPVELKDIPFYYVHCLDDSRPDIGLSPEYGAQLYEALLNSGFTNVYLKENQSGYATICDNFINENDISLLEWLFEQRRETK